MLVFSQLSTTSATTLLTAPQEMLTFGTGPGSRDGSVTGDWCVIPRDCWVVGARIEINIGFTFDTTAAVGGAYVRPFLKFSGTPAWGPSLPDVSGTTSAVSVGTASISFVVRAIGLGAGDLMQYNTISLFDGTNWISRVESGPTTGITIPDDVVVTMITSSNSDASTFEVGEFTVKVFLP